MLRRENRLQVLESRVLSTSRPECSTGSRTLSLISLLRSRFIKTWHLRVVRCKKLRALEPQAIPAHGTFTPENLFGDSTPYLTPAKSATTHGLGPAGKIALE